MGGIEFIAIPLFLLVTLGFMTRNHRKARPDSNQAAIHYFTVFILAITPGHCCLIYKSAKALSSPLDSIIVAHPNIFHIVTSKLPAFTILDPLLIVEILLNGVKLQLRVIAIWLI